MKTLAKIVGGILALVAIVIGSIHLYEVGTSQRALGQITAPGVGEVFYFWNGTSSSDNIVTVNNMAFTNNHVLTNILGDTKTATTTIQKSAYFNSQGKSTSSPMNFFPGGNNNTATVTLPVIPLAGAKNLGVNFWMTASSGQATLAWYYEVSDDGFSWYGDQTYNTRRVYTNTTDLSANKVHFTPDQTPVVYSIWDVGANDDNPIHIAFENISARFVRLSVDVGNATGTLAVSVATSQ